MDRLFLQTRDLQDGIYTMSQTVKGLSRLVAQGAVSRGQRPCPGQLWWYCLLVSTVQVQSEEDPES